MTIWLYLARSDIYYKIGVSSNPEERVESITAGKIGLSPELPEPLVLVWSMAIQPAYNCRICERVLHDRFQHSQVIGEWFALSYAEVTWIKAQTNESLLLLFLENAPPITLRVHMLAGLRGIGLYELCKRAMGRVNRRVTMEEAFITRLWNGKLPEPGQKTLDLVAKALAVDPYVLMPPERMRIGIIPGQGKFSVADSVTLHDLTLHKNTVPSEVAQAALQDLIEAFRGSGDHDHHRFLLKWLTHREFRTGVDALAEPEPAEDNEDDEDEPAESEVLTNEGEDGGTEAEHTSDNDTATA